MQKKYLLIPIITLISFSLLTSPFSLTHAASPSPSPSPSPISDQEVTDNLKKKIIENLDKAKTEEQPAATVRAYIGLVKDVIKDTIIMQDKDGKKDIKLQEDTNIIRTPGNAVIKAEDIRIDDSIIAIGYPGDGDTLTSRRLIVSTDPINSPAKISGIGTIAKISKTGLTLKLSDKDQVLFTTTKTIYKSSVSTIDATDLSIGDTLIYTATLDDRDEQTATILMRIQTASIAE